MYDYKHFKLERKEVLALIAVSVVLPASVGWLFYDEILLVLTAPLLMILLKPVAQRIVGQKRIKEIRGQFKDVLYSFSSSFATGMQMEEAMEVAARQLIEIYGDSSVMAKELTYMIKRSKEVSAGEVALWRDLGERTGIEDIKDFASVFDAARQAGGNLVKAVDRASSIIVDKINMETEMKLLFYQKKVEGYMVGAMPILMIGFLRLSSNSYLNVMYTTLAGRFLMTIALVAMLAGLYLTEKMTDVEI